MSVDVYDVVSGLRRVVWDVRYNVDGLRPGERRRVVEALEKAINILVEAGERIRREEELKNTLIEVLENAA